MDIRKIIREILEQEFNQNAIQDYFEKRGFELDERTHAHGYTSYYFYMPFDELEFVLSIIVEAKGGGMTMIGDTEPEQITTVMAHTADRNKETHHLFTKQVKSAQDIENLINPYIQKFKDEEHAMFLGLEPQEPVTLDKMKQPELQKLMDKALDRRDFSSAKKIGKYIRQ